MIYEWRTYEAAPGKLSALQTHLEVAAGLFKKHQLGVLGFWTEEIGTGGQVNYMWIYEDLAERERKLAAFGSDSAWKRQVAEETEREGGPVVARVHNTMLQLTPYSAYDQAAGVAHLRGDARETAGPPQPVRQPHPPPL
jgi:hypothetical protein